MSSLFTKGSEDRVSIIPNSNMVLDSALLNTQHYKVMIKGNMEQSRDIDNTANPVFLEIIIISLVFWRRWDKSFVSQNLSEYNGSYSLGRILVCASTTWQYFQNALSSTIYRRSVYLPSRVYPFPLFVQDSNIRYVMSRFIFLLAQ